jgi:putative tryptophan/tyrosine transport system substrate-binding protein
MKAVCTQRPAAGKKILGLAFCGLLFALCPPIEAQDERKVARVGFVSGSGDPSNPANSEKAFRAALRDLGYIEGKNFALEARYAKGDRGSIPALVAELVH